MVFLVLVIGVVALCAGLAVAVAVGVVLTRRSRQPLPPYPGYEQRRDGHHLPGGGVVGGL